MTFTLDELALKFGTDKASDGHGYTGIYEQLFSSLRDRPIELLELGVYAGASLKMWSSYFHPDSHIIGIDCGIISDLNFDEHPNVVVYQCDQTQVPTQMRDSVLDIIVDDASHQTAKTIASFSGWWPYLDHGGIYVVEDVSATYYQGKSIVVDYFKNLVDRTNHWKLRKTNVIYPNIDWILFTRDLVLVRKT